MPLYIVRLGDGIVSEKDDNFNLKENEGEVPWEIEMRERPENCMRR